MTIIKLDELISKLQEIKSRVGEDSSAILMNCDGLGDDRYGIGFGLVVADNATAEKMKQAEDNGNCIAKSDFDKVEVIGKSYVETGCLY